MKEDNLQVFTNENKFRYAGSSMRSTFKPGQVLYLRPTVKGIVAGDIVVYDSGGEYIVHRVKEVKEKGISTRGDNNLHDDVNFVSLGQIVGVVETVDDWGSFHSVKGGRKGLWIARLRWGVLALNNYLRPVVGAPYRWLKVSHWINKVWHPEVTSIQLRIPEGIIIKFIVRGKTVASWQPQLKRFICRRPYDLIIHSPGEIQ